MSGTRDTHTDCEPVTLWAADLYSGYSMSGIFLDLILDVCKVKSSLKSTEQSRQHGRLSFLII